MLCVDAACSARYDSIGLSALILHIARDGLDYRRRERSAAERTEARSRLFAEVGRGAAEAAAAAPAAVGDAAVLVADMRAAAAHAADVADPAAAWGGRGRGTTCGGKRSRRDDE